MKFARPINYKLPNITQGFSDVHLGVDYAYPEGTPVFAPADGVVTIVKTDETRTWIANTPSDPYKQARTRKLKTQDYGNYIKINHANNYSTLLAHLKPFSVLVKEGQIVQKGEKIAEIGSTGNSTGNHTHYEVRLDEKCIDPVSVLDASFSGYFIRSNISLPNPTPETDSEEEGLKLLREWRVQRPDGSPTFFTDYAKTLIYHDKKIPQLVGELSIAQSRVETLKQIVAARDKTIKDVREHPPLFAIPSLQLITELVKRLLGR